MQKTRARVEGKATCSSPISVASDISSAKRSSIAAGQLDYLAFVHGSCSGDCGHRSIYDVDGNADADDAAALMMMMRGRTDGC